MISPMLCNSRQDALAQTLHAVLKKANYKEIPLLLCRFSLC